MATTPSAPKTVIIGFNDYQYNHLKSLEQKLFVIFNDLQNIFKTNIGAEAKIDVEQLLNDPAEYLVDAYWAAFKIFHAPTSNKYKVFEQNASVSINQLHLLKNSFQDNYNQISNKYKPTIASDGITSNIFKEDFNYHLAKDKAKLFELLTAFLNVSNELKKYGASGDINLIRFSDKLLMDGTKAVINNTLFYE